MGSFPPDTYDRKGPLGPRSLIFVALSLHVTALLVLAPLTALQFVLFLAFYPAASVAVLLAVGALIFVVTRRAWRSNSWRASALYLLMFILALAWVPAIIANFSDRN